MLAFAFLCLQGRRSFNSRSFRHFTFPLTTLQSYIAARVLCVSFEIRLQSVAMAPPPSNESKVKEANKLAKSEPAKAENLYKEVLARSPGSNQAALQDYENALVGLGELYRDTKRSEDLAELVKTSRSTLSSFAKAKTAKLGRLCSICQYGPR